MPDQEPAATYNEHVSQLERPDHEPTTTTYDEHGRRIEYSASITTGLGSCIKSAGLMCESVGV
jgi:YD repeat-containing protein